MAKYKTKGCILKVGVANPPTVVLGQLGDSTIDLGARAALQDSTTHDNTSGTFDKLDVGFIEPPKISGDIMYDPADSQHETIRAAHQAGTLLYYQLILPTTPPKPFTFQGRVSGFSIPVPVNGKLMGNLSVDGVGAYSTA